MKNNNIRHFREFKGYSQEYVGHLLGKSQAALSKMENGYISISDGTINQLCKILEVSKEKLFEDESILLQSLNDMAIIMSYQLSENKKLLLEVDLNQEKIQKQINSLLKKVSKSSICASPNTVCS